MYLPIGTRFHQEQLSMLNTPSLRIHSVCSCERGTMKYKIQKKLGSGAYGDVFEAVCEDNSIIAIKKSEIYDNGISVQSMREISLMKHMKHTNILRIIEISFRDNCMYICSEKSGYVIKNETIYDLCQLIQKTKVSEKDSLFICKDILKGVEYMHDKQLQHRDIKPSNILVFKENSRLTCKIADFGLSRKQGHPLSREVVTIWYRAPEVLLQMPYGSPIDCWSVGAVFAELNLGFPIFGIQNPTDIQQLLKIVDVLGHYPGDYLDSLNLSFSIKYTESNLKFENTLLMQIAMQFLKYNDNERLTCKEALTYL